MVFIFELSHGERIWIEVFVAINKKRHQYKLYWHCILITFRDIFNSSANNKSIINFSNPCKQFERLKCSANFYIKEMPSKTFFRKVFHTILIFCLFNFNLCSSNYQKSFSYRKWFKWCKTVIPLFYNDLFPLKLGQITPSPQIIMCTYICQLNTSKSLLWNFGTCRRLTALNAQ